MFAHNPALSSIDSTRRSIRHMALLTGVSVATLCLATLDAGARSLGGGSGASSPSQVAVGASQSAAAAAAQAAQQSQNALNRATNAIRSLQQMQGAARSAAAAGGGVTDGLLTGGLDRASGANAFWVGAGEPIATMQGDRTRVNITQTQKNAVLTWKTFNVGERTDLNFDQKGQRDWIALNRVIDPDLAPSRILGTIKSDGTVLVINPNGIIFGAGAQINVGSLMAGTLDVGPQAAQQTPNGSATPTGIAWRNNNFLLNGLLTYASGQTFPQQSFSALTVPGASANTGAISITAGASITTRDGGLALFAAPYVTNAGSISAPTGQVILAATGTSVYLTPSTGTASDNAQPPVGVLAAAPDPNIRGLVAAVTPGSSASRYYVWNQASGLIQADRGNITLISPASIPDVPVGGAVYNDGILASTTSVSRNGSITINGADIRFGSRSLLTILADKGGETIPQDPTSLGAFKPSAIKIGEKANLIEMQSGAALLAPGANVQFGATTPSGDASTPLNQSILINAGAEINVAGLTNVEVPISQVQIVIDPAKKNELRDSPLYRDGFLNGATIYLDPRRSGVRADGVAWIGSPLIDATAYYQMVGLSADRLMTKGGTVTFGPVVNAASNVPQPYNMPKIYLMRGSVIDTSGGWLSYQAGSIRTTRLIDQSGRIVDIGDADPNAVYVGIYNGGFTRQHRVQGQIDPRLTEVWTSIFDRGNGHSFIPAHDEGRDAGVLMANAAALILESTIKSQVYSGARQRADSKVGSGKSSVAGDLRPVQASNNQLPAGGALIVRSMSDVSISHVAPVVIDNIDAGWTRGAIAAETGKYVAPTPAPGGTSAPGPAIPASRTATLFLTDDTLSKSGFSQVSLSGKITVGSDANVVLNAGGVIELNGRIEINGNITAPGGKINLVGTDIIINGGLSVAGRWVNDFTAPADYLQGSAWLNGGSISMTVFSSFKYLDANGNVATGARPAVSAVDTSGSILINPGARLNLSGGGRVDRKGAIDFGARGGNLTLTSDVFYYPTRLSGLRITSTDDRDEIFMPINPERINARIVIDPASLQAHGFGGGGTFTLTTPEFSFGTGEARTGTVLPIDFFSSTGFVNYNITSYKTDLSRSTFTNGAGGYDALLAVQTVTVRADQNLALVQSTLSNLLTADQLKTLRGLDNGGDINTVVPASVPADAFDQRPVNLKLGGAIELHVAAGGRVTGAAGSSLTVGGLLNEGSIRIPGGSITQELILPRLYASGAPGQNEPVGIRSLADVFSVNADGNIDPNADSRYKTANGQPISNQDLAGNFSISGGPIKGRAIYKLGLLDQGNGIVLASGSVTDLSGAVMLNPRAVAGRTPITTGVIVGGGTLAALPSQVIGTTSSSPFRTKGAIVARPGAIIDLSGAFGAFDVPSTDNDPWRRGGYAPSPVWSDGGALLADAGATLTGAIIRADSGSAQGQGGTLQILNPIFMQHDPATPLANAVSADMLARSGFDTFIATGNITSRGDVAIAMDRAFFLQPKPYDGVANATIAVLAPVISTGGALTIAAPYIGLQNSIDVADPMTSGTPGTGTVTFRGRQIDITGMALFDRSVSRASFEASGDIRLTGVVPYVVSVLGQAASTPTLRGGIAVVGDLTMIADQIYPTTGTSFAITSSAANGTVTFGRSSGVTPATPYSAGGNLLVQAANIVQGGVLRVPFGSLTLGSNAATSRAPATRTVVLADGSVTSVSAGGLSIPYGTTIDTMEWYFAPAGNDPLTAPPSKLLNLSASAITMAAGATVDITGGGDVYAYEFVPGTGGSRDVLSQFNSDQYSANRVNGVGYQYPDGRQVYAIVPGLSAAPAAAYDPIYSANYASLSAAGGVGRRVYLAGGSGLAAGWYTLLPAQYAMLPGGMRVVEQTGAKNVTSGFSIAQADGSLLTSGYYGDALSGASQSQFRLFSVQPQKVIRAYSNIVLTSGNDYARTEATKKGIVVPQVGLDSGRLVLNPLTAMTIDATVLTAAAPGGRGAQVDISGSKIAILSTLAGAPADGAIQLTAAGLNRLNAESLLIGGIRTDNADGTTSLALTSNSILVANDAAHPLMAPEIVLAVDDGISGNVASKLTLNDGATIIATGAMSDRRSGAYVIDAQLTSSINASNETVYLNPAQSAIGALVRVANGPQRVVQRLRTPVSTSNPGSPAGLAASLALGNAILQGDAIGLDTSHNASIASGTILRGKDIALGAGALAFTSGNAAAGVVVITPQLQAILSQGNRLTLRSQTSIGFDDGNYSFGDTTFDATALLSRQGGAVTINASHLEFGNAGTAGSAAAGRGSLTIVVDELSIGNGAIAASGFAAVSLTAVNGMFSAGTNGVLDVGAANLAIVTPYMGDRARPGSVPTSSTSMTLRSTGTVNIAKAGAAARDVAQPAGIPGSSLTIEGNGVSVAGTHLRATAGALTIKSSGNLALSNGAVLEAPGYDKTFGDAADPQTASAPGGTLSLAALGTGGIALGDAVLSVGGGVGNGGTLKLSAANGAVDWGTAVLSGKGGADGQGGRFALDTSGAVDLVGMNARAIANGFTGGLDIRTRSGDIILDAGQLLKSGSVNLTADGGFVTIGGTIDTSGISGGDIALYGKSGVKLLSGAKLDSHASGYASDDTRKAAAGDVTLGTDFVASTINADGSVSGTSGAITVAAGAMIDASVSRPGNRLVRIMRGGVVNYAYVEGDQGGIVRFRAPVVNGNDMNVDIVSANSLSGARTVELEGFKRWDLAAVAASGLYTGITRDVVTDTITLDLRPGLDSANSDGTRAVVAGLNFLGDEGAGTVVSFVQGFDVSAAAARLNGLQSRANFTARPGVELKHDGNITLASNWNLGAGRVNVDAAKAQTRPLMKVDSTTGQNYVVVGREAELLADYTTMLYRVGGRATGAAPLVSLRAGGNLQLKSSLTDGFFQFRDQYDATYQSYLNAKPSNFTLQLMTNGIVKGGDGSSLIDWTSFVSSLDPYGDYYFNHLNSIDYAIEYIDQLPGRAGAGGRLVVPIPFNVSGNSPAALGTGTGGAGDPLASAVVFPLLPGGRVAASSDYRLTAGAATTSADPLRIAPTKGSNLIVDVAQPTSMAVPIASAGGSFSVEVYGADYSLAGSFLAGQGGFEAFLRDKFPGISDDAAISLPYANFVPASLRNFIDTTLSADPSAHVLIWNTPNWGEVTMSVAQFARYLQQNPSGFGGGGSAGNVTIRLLPQTMVRTGTGSIRMAAAGNVDLTGGSAMTYIDGSGNIVSAPTPAAAGSGGAGQLGGAAVYTVGHPVSLDAEVLRDPVPDPVTGKYKEVTIGARTPIASIFSAPPDYRYGLQTAGASKGIAGVVLVDPLQLTGGGDVAVTAQGSVLGRRDLSLNAMINGTPPQWVGSMGTVLRDAFSDQPWRVHTATQDTLGASINPQLFRAGIGALGGGDVLIEAGGSVSDIQAVADTSLTTVVATPSDAASTRMLMTSGGGNVSLRAGNDILAARIDAASGVAQLSAGGRIGSLPVIVGYRTFAYRDPANNLRNVTVPTVQDSETVIRIDDAAVDLAARGDITIQGIKQLDGFYSDASAINLVANGSITITNSASSVSAIFPGTLTLASLMGNANLRTYAVPPGYEPPGNSNWALSPAAYNYGAPYSILMVPTATGQLRLLVGGNILPTSIAMLDSDPNLLPGLFTLGGANLDRSLTLPGVTRGYGYAYPAVLSNTPEGQLERLHMAAATHAADRAPAYVYAGGDIGTAASGVRLFLPKQARIGAGQDIVNMMFFGQNLAPDDITRIVAGRDLTATSRLTTSEGAAKPTLLGNSFILGGPGDLIVEAGRNMGPFLNSAVVRIFVPDANNNPVNTGALTFGGGIVTVGNDWNPYLPEQGANITVLFGTGKGADYDALRDAYLAPGSVRHAMGDYGAKLIAWMQNNASDVLQARFGTTKVSDQQAYEAFVSLPALRQRLFLINGVYFDELRAAAVKDGPSYLKYSRGYSVVNTLFPAALGYTANGLEGGANDGARVQTGDLDLRLAAIETVRGGNINILGPGGRVLAGSVVSTAQQAARRNYAGYALYQPERGSDGRLILPIEVIPVGYEGVISLRGGTVNTFTDGDFLLNQSRLFTVKGGDITMWSSNADLNAGQGAKTTPNYPPAVVRIGKNLFAESDQAGATTGAGIAALPPDAGTGAPDVYLLAPRGAVDAGDAGVRSAGNLSVAALRVVNADNFKVSGITSGIPTVVAPNIAGLSEAANTIQPEAKQAAIPGQGGSATPSVIIVEVLGYGGGTEENENDNEKRKDRQSSNGYDTNNVVRLLGNGTFDAEDLKSLTAAERNALAHQIASPAEP
jgi:filamentous hemagglutinin family protein